MSKIIILTGLPASGKTTWAKQFINDNPGWVRVNKDELRQELLSDGWSKSKEQNVIIPARNQRITEALAAGQSVIVDDTNLAKRHIQDISRLADVHLAEIEVKNFEIGVEEAIKRDSRRVGTAHVGEAVIRGMARQLLPKTSRGIHPDTKIVKVQPIDGPWAIICDIDGTIAHHEGVRDVYDGSKCHLDNVDAPVRSLLYAMRDVRNLPPPAKPEQAYTLIYLSGREEKWRDGTLEFFRRQYVPYDGHLYMRPTGDSRDDTIVKQELFDQHVRNQFNVRFVLDDRNKVVDFWRAIGLTCLQVADGDF